MKNNRGEK